MAIVPFIVTDDALNVLDSERPNFSAALGDEGFIERFTASSHHVIGRTIPTSGSWADLGRYYGFFRTGPDVLIIDWNIFMAPTREADDLIPVIRFALDTGHSVVIEARGANPAKLKIIAVVLAEPLGVQPEVRHSAQV